MIKTTKKHPKLVSKVKTGERRAELEAGLEDVMNRDRAINSQEVIAKNKIREMKEKVIQALFTILEDFGVDPSNLESINLFLDKLRQQNPDLLKLFEIAFNDLIGGQEEAGTDTGVGTNVLPPDGLRNTGLEQQGLSATSNPVSSGGSTGLMDKYKDLAQNTMMPR